MKIAMVSEHASPLAVVGEVDAGGQNVHVAALASALALRGHRVDVYTRRDHRDLPPSAPLRDGVMVHHLDAGPAEHIAKDELLPHMPQFTQQLQAALEHSQPGVLHGHFWMSGLACTRVAASLDLSLVQTFHALGSVKRRLQGAADTSPEQRIALERDVAERADRVIASCTDEKRELVRMGAHPGRIDIVPSGVDCDWFVPGGARALRTARPRLLVVGRLVPRKGVDDAITALQWIDDAELIIAGGPNADDLQRDPEARRLTALAAEVGVADRVHLIGQVPHTELTSLIRSADLMLCLPWYEPFGIVPLEAMACGIPVVGSAVGGLLDTVIDGVTGALLPPRQPGAVAATVTALLGDEPRRRAYGRAGRERALNYTWEQVARSTERTYLRAIMGRRPEADLVAAEQSGGLL
jgi:glycosyltransferase involved in cell wall biosynthesis